MAGDQNMKEAAELDVDALRKIVRSFIDLHLYSAALFWADKIVCLSGGDARDVYWMAQCMFHLKQYHRAAHAIQIRGLEKTHMPCHYLAVKSLLEAREFNEAQQIITENEGNTALLSPVVGNIECYGEPSSKEFETHLQSAMLFLKGRVFEELENRVSATNYYKQALNTNVHCYEAFEALTKHQMLSTYEEHLLFESLPFSQQCSSPVEEKLLRLLYESKLKQYQSPKEVSPAKDTLLSLPSPFSRLSSNLDLRVSQAERYYYNCSYRECIRMTEEILKRDPYHNECLPVHISCLVELKKVNKLFYLAHHLVDLYPEMAIAWFAVGCYYYLIGKSDPARRYLGKATTLDKLFGPAWLAYGHSFATENEHDQALAAYFKASQLMKGCHLPLLYIGLEYGLTNNGRLAEKFFLQAQTIAPEDPFVMHEMGVIAFQNQDYYIAERHFEDALNKIQNVMEPINSDKWEPLLNNLGHTCRKLNKYNEALEYHRKALVLRPLNPSTYASMGYVYALQGELSEAADSFHKALGIRRDDTFSTTMLTYVMEQMAETLPPFQGAGTFKCETFTYNPNTRNQDSMLDTVDTSNPPGTVAQSDSQSLSIEIEMGE